MTSSESAARRERHHHAARIVTSRTRSLYRHARQDRRGDPCGEIKKLLAFTDGRGSVTVRSRLLNQSRFSAQGGSRDISSNIDGL